MTETFRHLDALRGREERAVMATLLATRGTTPKREGAKMWVGEGGRVLGSVTIGGCVDARVIEESEEVLEEGRARRVSMSLSDEEAWDLGMTCGGTVDLLLEPVALAGEGDGVIRAYGAVREALDSGRKAVAAAPLDGSPARLVVSEEGEAVGTLGDEALDREVRGAAREAMGVGRSTLVTVGEGAQAREVFLELHAPPTTLLVFGAGDVAMPLVNVAKELGWRVVVIDNRERFATQERFPRADEIRRGLVSRTTESFAYTPSVAVVVVAHDYKYEVPVLKAVLAGDPAYVGVLGSRKRGRALLDFLAEAGVSEEALERVRVPVGLDLGAETAAEIAVSIVAEVLAALRDRPGTPLAEGAPR